MANIQEILVPVDFSEGSNAALEQAAFIAGQLGANLHVLHVWQVPAGIPSGSPGVGLASLGEVVETQAEQQLRRLVDDARSRGITIGHAISEPGVPSTSIIEKAAKQRYDLIVMGTHGRTGIVHTMLGSVAERVVRRARCPVMTVREGAPTRPRTVSRVLVPVDYSEGSRRALEFAAEFARAFGAELDVVHVWDRPAYVSGDVVVHGPSGARQTLAELVRESAEHQMKDFLESFSAPRDQRTLQFPAHRLLSGEPASTLITELEKGGHDLVILGTHGRTGFRHFLLGSVAEKLVQYAPVPVLTVPSVANP